MPTRRCSSASRCSTGRDESLVIWTTTPWTLPANVAAAVKPDAEYGRRENGEWVAVARYPDEAFVRARSGARSSSAGATAGPFDDLGPAARSSTASIPWDEVTLDEGTGIVHIAPGCGGEDFELVEGASACRADARSTRRAASTTTTAGCTASRPTESADQIVGVLGERGLARRGGPLRAPLPALLALRHAADLPALRRLVHRASTSFAPQLLERERGRSSGCPRTWASAWTTGSATWATGTSRGAATTACRCRSTRARAGT